jgi:hypothetical protein
MYMKKSDYSVNSKQLENRNLSWGVWEIVGEKQPAVAQENRNPLSNNSVVVPAIEKECLKTLKTAFGGELLTVRASGRREALACLTFPSRTT